MNGWIRIGVKAETKQFDAQINELRRKAETLEKTLESDMQIPVELRMDEESRIKLRSDLQKTKNQIISLQQQADKGVNLRSKETKKGFEDMFKSAKRFALGLISVRGVYTILSKASQAYMATDEKTTQQMEANWVGLGTVLAPAIDLIMQLFRKAVTSILYFMSVLTGVNYIEKANTAILKKQTEATKELTKANDKMNASFDEMNVLQDPSKNTGNTGIDSSALFDISEIGESARQTIERLGKSLQPVYKVIKDIIKWCVDNPDVVLTMIGGVALLTMLGKVIGYAGAGTAVGVGLAGVYGLLLAIIALGVITISIKTIVDSEKDLQDTLKVLNDISDSTVKNNQNMNQLYRDFIKNNDNSAESVQALTDQLLNQIDTISENNQNIETAIDELGWYEKMWWNATGATEENGQVMFDNTKKVFDNIASLVMAEKQGKLTKEQTERLTEQLTKLTTETDIATLSTEDLASRYDLTIGEAQLMKDMIKDVSEAHKIYAEETYGATEETKKLETAIKNMPNKKNIEIDVETEKATKKTKSWWKDIINNVISLPINSISDALGLKFKIPYLATGGIINNPGAGVPLGLARGGEAGAEGVIPLTDTQAMETLGATIGKYITINANITNTMNGRVISREIKRISANDDFASNS